MSSLSKRISNGMAWQAISVTLSKASNILAVIILGWLLTKEQFAIYALAISASAIITSLRNGGVQPVLIQRGEKSFNRTYQYFLRYALLTNASLLLIIIAASFVYAQWYDSETVGYLMMLIGISIPLSILVLPYRVCLSFKQRFDVIAKIDTISAVSKNFMTVIFALLGFEVYSFVLPLVIVPFIEYFVAKNYETDLPKERKISQKVSVLVIFHKVKWILLAALCTSLILQGDYLVLGFIESKYIIGIYFFGYQLSASLSVLVTSGMRNIMLPVFASLKKDSSQQISVYEKSMVLVLLIMGGVSFGAVCVMPAIIDFVWAGRWNEAIIVVQLMMLCLLTKITAPLGRSLLEARGRWRLVSGLLIFDALGTMLAALLGGYLGGVSSIAFTVAIYRFLYGVLNIILVSKIICLSNRMILATLALVIVIGIVSMAIYFSVEGLLTFDPIVNSFLAGTVFALVYSAMIFIFRRNEVSKLIVLVRKKSQK